MEEPTAIHDGTLLVDKPSDMTSFGVVARVRRVLSNKAGKRVKVGHTGTLDPFATGLMILVVGKECRNAGLYSKLDKVYEATFCLGIVSTTGDPEGEKTQISDEVPTKEAIEAVLTQFCGEIQQRPPAYSAIKIKGQRAYSLARKGEAVEIPVRTVNVLSFELIDYAYPEVRVRAHVGSGTYIRSLAEDVGLALGTGAYCSQLRRTIVGDWSIADAYSLQELGVTDMNRGQGSAGQHA